MFLKCIILELLSYFHDSDAGANVWYWLMIIIVHAQCSWIVHPKLKILTLIIFSSSCFPKPVWDYSIFLFSESRQKLSSLFKTKKHYKSGPYNLWAIVHVFWSHIISLCDEQTKMYYSLMNHEDLKTFVSNHSSS